MTYSHDAIRGLYQDGESHWEIMARLVAKGASKRSAADKVAAALHMDKATRAEMVDAYDNNC